MGGEIFYDYVGNNNYQITFKLYRDCINGGPNFGGLDSTDAILNITDYHGDVVRQVILGVPVVSYISGNVNDPCITFPEGICVEVGYYTTIINLPPRINGYFLVYETCCRNNSILNIINPSGQGSTYKTHIPGPELAATNSSPRFNQYPSLFICQGKEINFDHSATDPDGDSLVYSIVAAPNGFSVDSLVPYKAPYSGAYPVSSNPALSIDNNGVIHGVPNLIGQWVICVRVQEYRNGKLLDSHYRDFQYNVISCHVIVKPSIAEETNKCQGSTITFTNQSFSNFKMHYFWDFGVPNSSADTSYAKHPTYTFADTGKYEVTLIVNPGLSCADSIKKLVYVYPKLDVSFSVPNSVQCVKNNTVEFNISGNYHQDAVITCDFGNNQFSTEPMNKVVYADSGVYLYKLEIKQFACKKSMEDSIRFIARPISKINSFPEKLCNPTEVTFSNGSFSNYASNYLWEVNSDMFFSQTEPTHFFSSSGTYTVALTTLRGGVCADTVTSEVSTFTIFPSPVSGFILSDSITSIFDPEIAIINNSSSDASKFTYDFGDGTYSHYMNEKHIYALPGSYIITQTIENNFECAASSKKTLVVEPEFRFWMPNAFTPDGNGLNDVFKPIVIGALDYTFTIYNRFGEKIFSTNDTQKGWDGFFKGKLCKQGSYIWEVIYTNEITKKAENKIGNVTLFSQTY